MVAEPWPSSPGGSTIRLHSSRLLCGDTEAFDESQPVTTQAKIILTSLSSWAMWTKPGAWPFHCAESTLKRVGGKIRLA